MKSEPKRCDWATNSLAEKVYHDNIWGKPEHRDQNLFKMLILEGMQAGLSWRTVLNKQKAMEEALDNFQPEIIAHYNQKKEFELLQNQAIIRHRLKIESLKYNAQTFLAIREEFGSFNQYLWRFVNFQPVLNQWQSSQEVPTQTELSLQISNDLKQRGFKFVGPTIVYAYMQAIGMVNDHLIDCSFR